jgi:hypothetical protein
MVFRAVASSSSIPSTPTPTPIASNSLLMQPTEKFTKANHIVWHAQLCVAIRRAKLMGYITDQTKAPPSVVPQVGTDGKEIKDDVGKVLMMPNPDFEDWDATDQQVLSYSLGSLSNEVLIQISTYTTSTEAWATIQGVFASRTRA